MAYYSIILPHSCPQWQTNSQGVLQRSLQNVGFTQLESQVLLALFSLGEGTAADVAKRTELNRSTVYVSIQRLVERGFVSELPSHKVKRFIPADPSKLLSVSRENVENLKSMLPLIQGLYNRSGKKPRIEFYEGAEAVASVWETFGRANEARYVSSYNRLRNTFGNKIDRWAEAVLTGKTKTQVRQLMSQDEDGKRFAKKLFGKGSWENRFFPEGVDADMDLAIVDDQVAITHFDPLYIVVLSSKPLADSMKLIFDMAWSTALDGEDVVG